jgi:hypothetical protein
VQLRPAARLTHRIAPTRWTAPIGKYGADRKTRRKAWKVVLITELIVGIVTITAIYTFMAITDYATWSVAALFVFVIAFPAVLAYTQRGKRWDD